MNTNAILVIDIDENVMNFNCQVDYDYQRKTSFQPEIITINNITLGFRKQKESMSLNVDFDSGMFDCIRQRIQFVENKKFRKAKRYLA